MQQDMNLFLRFRIAPLTTIIQVEQTKKVDLDSDHAYWYTNRIDATDAYGFVVNTENLDDWALTIYVDANINDRDGNFTGIAGVGKRITHLQNILTSYLEDQGVEAYIVDAEGMIKVHKNNEYIKNVSLYDLENIPREAIDVKQGQNEPFEKRMGNKFFIVQQFPTLEWYLVVKKKHFRVNRSAELLQLEGHSDVGIWSSSDFTTHQSCNINVQKTDYHII